MVRERNGVNPVFYEGKDCIFASVPQKKWRLREVYGTAGIVGTQAIIKVKVTGQSWKRCCISSEIS
jgi:hypothetical protein